MRTYTDEERFKLIEATEQIADYIAATYTKEALSGIDQPFDVHVGTFCCGYGVKRYKVAFDRTLVLADEERRGCHIVFGKAKDAADSGLSIYRDADMMAYLVSHWSHIKQALAEAYADKAKTRDAHRDNLAKMLDSFEV